MPRHPRRAAGANNPYEGLRQQAHPIEQEETNQTAENTLPSRWSVDAMQRERSKLSILADITFIILPLIFIALAFAALLQDGKPVRISGRAVRRALLLSPTIFPMVFAAVCGHFMNSIALYKSQTGLSMKLLEHLAGARSIFTAMERFFLLQSFGWGWLIIFIWGLSPIGGQALLRLLYAMDNYKFSNSTIAYMGPDFLSTSPLISTQASLSTLSYVTTLYLASLVAPMDTQNSPRDLWGNPKVPSPKSFTEGGNGNWTALHEQDSRKYLGLVGVPIRNLTGGTNSRFTIEALSMDVRCSSNNATTIPAFASSLEAPLYETVYENGIPSIKFQQFKLQTSGIPTSFLKVDGSSWQSFRQDQSIPFTIYYGSQATAEDNPQISLATCNMSLASLESDVSCSDRSCEIAAMRNVPANLTQDQLNTLQFLLNDGTFCGLGIGGQRGQSSVTERFLADPTAVIDEAYEPTLVKLWTLSPEILEERLALAFNTFYYTAASQIFAAGSGSANTTRVGSTVPWVNTTAALSQNTGNQYIYSRKWFAAALIISGVLECMALCSAILRYKTHVPDVFGCVSSMVMDNPHCQEMELRVSSALDGLDRARELGEQRFTLRDVNPERGVGHIAFVPPSDGMKNRGRVKYGKWYD